LAQVGTSVETRYLVMLCYFHHNHFCYLWFGFVCELVLISAKDKNIAAQNGALSKTESTLTRVLFFY
jgi:hypothetical protein